MAQLELISKVTFPVDLPSQASKPTLPVDLYQHLKARFDDLALRLQPCGLDCLVQQAFIDHNAPQCGFCTSGQLMSATALLQRNADPTVREIREALAGNLCRCSNYNAIVEAVQAAAKTGGA